MMRKNKLVGGLAALLTLGTVAACSDSGAEYTLHYATYSSPTSDQSKVVQRWAADVEEATNGEVEVIFHYSGSLIGAEDALQATLDGRVDIAQVGSIYAASDLSMYTVVDLPFKTKNPEVHMHSIMRLYEESETYREDFERQGVKLMYPLPLGSMMIGLSSPAATPEDLEGRSIRAGGLTSQVIPARGANPVAMGANDIYESLERGIVQGYTSISLPNLPAFGLTRSTDYVVDPGIGVAGSSIVVINQDLYESMPEEYQQAIDEASANSLQYGTEEMDAAGAAACTELREAGTEFSAFEDADVEDWRGDLALDQDWVTEFEERGYDAQGVFDDFERIIAEEEPLSDYSAPLNACMEGSQ